MYIIKCYKKKFSLLGNNYSEKKTCGTSAVFSESASPVGNNTISLYKCNTQYIYIIYVSKLLLIIVWWAGRSFLPHHPQRMYRMKFLEKLNEKQMRTMVMIPRIAIVMGVSFYCSGFVKSNLDIIWFAIGISFLTVLLFFVPLSKLVSSNLFSKKK